MGLLTELSEMFLFVVAFFAVAPFIFRAIFRAVFGFSWDKEV